MDERRDERADESGGEYSIISDEAFVLSARTCCWRCRAGIHCEPNGAFFTLRGAPPGGFEITPLAGRVRLTGDEGFEP